MLDLGLRKSHLFLGRQAGAAELAGSLEKKCNALDEKNTF